MKAPKVKRVKAELEAKTDRILAAESMAYSLANQIGNIEPHEHPDEQKPRAQTWLQERKNWTAEVDQLRARVAELEVDKERLDWLETQDELETYEDAQPATVWTVFTEPGGRCDIRAAIDAARGKGQP